MSSPSLPRDGTSTSSRDGLISKDTGSSAVGGPTPPRLRTPRTLPPWVDSYAPRYGSAGPDQFHLLNPPPRTRPHHLNSTPTDLNHRRISTDGFVDYDDERLGPGKKPLGKVTHFFKFAGRGSLHGRKWDHLRTDEPVIVPMSSRVHPAMQNPLGWKDFLHSSSYGHSQNEKSEIVDPEMLDQLQPNFNRPVEEPINPLDPRMSRPRRTLALSKRAWYFIMRSSFIPLMFRLTVMVTSILALGVSARIFRLEAGWKEDSAERTQALVAVVVDCVAIPYIGYMIYDEYTGKPLGLRSGVSKMCLILLDLFFIIFKSASTALAFESVVYHNLKQPDLRALSKVLAVFQLIGLIAWDMTFTVNIFRTVERLGGGEDDSV
ncbi:hypothetical protein NLU13_4791 [Sarocladium strictum]|uniref:Regulator of phospholipase D SRF1 n=1 Tax=Sarocladium strictum TaxID=5046 RepID=A0AA39L910_SARSR|nr:hypothetical protein NLU13_4791 [Sarocladium strictum]